MATLVPEELKSMSVQNKINQSYHYRYYLYLLDSQIKCQKSFLDKMQLFFAKAAMKNLKLIEMDKSCRSVVKT